MTPANITVPVLADGFVADAIEYHSDILIRGCEQDASSHWEALDFFWKLYTGRITAIGNGAGASRTPQPRRGRSKYGRICNRRRMAQIIVMCSQCKDDDHAPMLDWSAPKWRWLRSQMDTLRESLMRADSHEPLKDPSDENCAADTRRLCHPLFSNKYEKLGDILLINEVLSPLRGPILRQLQINSSKRTFKDSCDLDDQDGQEPTIPQEDLRTFS